MNRSRLIWGGLAVATISGLLVAERRRPSRPSTQTEPRRTLGNTVMGAACMAVITIVERPLIEQLTRTVEARRWGLAQQLPAPVRDIAAFLLLDWAMYGWHVAAHRVSALWQLHRVHHVDLDMDASTALRFHAVDMLVSVPFRLVQATVAGAGPRAQQAWQSFFFASVLFHHSRLALPARWERRLSRVLTTPGMHDIHHRAAPDALDSNWSSGLSLWDHLHRTFNAARPAVPIGVPGFEKQLSVSQLLALPWRSKPHADPFPHPAQP